MVKGRSCKPAKLAFLVRIQARVLGWSIVSGQWLVVRPAEFERQNAAPVMRFVWVQVPPLALDGLEARPTKGDFPA